jgi:acetate kinase
MMQGQVLVVNCGSSSLKLARVEASLGSVLEHALAERLGSPEARIVWRSGDTREVQELPGIDHARALGVLLQRVDVGLVQAVGHRVVHGGEAFRESVVLDAAAIDAITACAELAPLHNPANLIGIRAARAALPALPQVAVFDTAFHQTMPAHAYMYAIPHVYYTEHRVRRYGFHGTSHAYVAGLAAERLQRPLEQLQLVTAHLGNGCSACAVRGGQSVDTTMGFTPLEGLVMGTRSGDVDPDLHAFLGRRLGLDLNGISRVLNQESGLLGLSGVSNDMRTLLEREAEGNARAGLAVDVFCHRLAKAILGLGAALERIDALIFTGGIGENAAPVRARTLAQLSVLGARLDGEHNRAHGKFSDGRITRPDSGLLALVVPTNEELFIAREALRRTDARKEA